MPTTTAAQEDLATAYYATNSARAAFYPGLTITANGGFTNLLGSMVKNPGEWFYQLAGSLVAPLFSRGQNIARLEATKAQQKQALNNFEYAIMNASAEVSDALTIYEKSQEKSALLVEQVANLEKSVEYTKDLMLYSPANTINLYQALGGGR